MTSSDPPRNGSDRAGVRPRAAPLRAANQPDPNTRGQAPAVQQSSTAVGAAKMRKAANGNGGAPPAAATTRARAASESSSALSSSRETKKAVPAAGEPYPPLSDRPVHGIGTAAAGSKNPKQIMPRSPRTALEPDTVEMPTRRSKSVRHPFVVIGNAIISIFVLAAIVAGIALVIGKQRFEAPGPSPEDRIVNIPRGAGIRDIADVLGHEGVIDQPWVFIGGVLVLKAREDLKAGEYQFKAHASNEHPRLIDDALVHQHVGDIADAGAARNIDDAVLRRRPRSFKPLLADDKRDTGHDRRQHEDADDGIADYDKRMPRTP